MNFTAFQFHATSPEWVLLAISAIGLLVVTFFRDGKRDLPYIVMQLGIVVAGLLSACHMNEQATTLFNGQFVFSPLTSFLKCVILALVFGAMVYAKTFLKDHNLQSGEYYLLVVFATLGMLVLVSAGGLLTFYLSLELMSLPLYALVALSRDCGRASEAAMKYFVMGALASGLILYGISMLYGATGSLSISAISQALHTLAPQHHLILIFGMVFVFVGLAFKLGAAPFHMWAPDVYHGAPNAVVVLLASAPKVAVLAFMLRFLTHGTDVLFQQWHEMLLVMALLSIVIGNVVAVVQTNLKRMLAYSSVAHMGYLFLALQTNTKAGFSAALFYIITYAVMSLGAFALLVLLSQSGLQAETVDDLKGLNERNPWLAFMMLLILFSMAGVPPTVGFFAKLGIISALVAVHQVWLAVVAVLLAVVGAYYYLRVIRVMYFDKSPAATPVAVVWDQRLAFTVNGLVVLYLGLFPAGLMHLCQSLLA